MLISEYISAFLIASLNLFTGNLKVSKKETLSKCEQESSTPQRVETLYLKTIYSNKKSNKKSKIKLKNKIFFTEIK